VSSSAFAEESPSAAGPYKGLAPFEDSELDALLFFGRERERDVIVANLMASPLTIFYGPSGVGKSSLLRAGVAYHLRLRARDNLARTGQPEFAVAVFSSWKEDPIAGIAAAVEHAARGALPPGTGEPAHGGGSLADLAEAWAEMLGGELYIVLDQVEEYFLYHGGDGSGRLGAELSELLRRRGLAVNVLLGIREDALAKLDAFKSRIPNLFSNSLRLDLLDRRAGEAAVLGPLRRWSELKLSGEAVLADPELVEAVLDEVTAGKIDPGLVGRGVVEETGAGERIETPYLQLVLQKLWEVERASGSRRLRLATLRDLGGAQHIVEEHLEHAMRALTGAQQDAAASMFDHLVTPSGTKIAHELGDLATYASSSKSELEPVVRSLAAERILRPLGDGHNGGRYEIYHDVLAQAVLAWRAKHATDRRVEVERRDARRRHARLLAVVAAALVGLVALAAVTVFALNERNRSADRARAAQARALAATAFSQLPFDPELSLMLAREAARREPTPQVEDALRRALIESRVRSVLRTPGLRPVLAAALLRGGTTAVTIGEDGVLRLFSRRSRDQIGTFPGSDALRVAAFSADGELVATVGTRGDVRLRRTETGEPVAGFSPPPVARAIAFAPSGRFFATAGRDRRARLYEAATGQLLATIRLDHDPASIAVSSDGSLVATGGGNHTIRVWNRRTGAMLQSLASSGRTVFAVAFNPAGDRLATGSTDGLAQVWEVTRGEPLARMIGHVNFVRSAAFSPDGSLLMTAGPDRTARVWDARTGRQLGVLRGHGDTVVGASFAAGGELAVTAAADGTARIWDARGEPRLSLLRRFPRPLADATTGPAGRIAVAVGKEVVLLDAEGRPSESLAQEDKIGSVSFSADGRLVSAVAGRQAVVWQPTEGRVRRVGLPVAATTASLSPDGSLVVVGGRDGVSRVSRLDGRVVATLRSDDGPVLDAAFDQAGERIVTASADSLGYTWTVRGKLERRLRGHRSAVTSATFSPDGRFVLTASADHDGRIWSRSTGMPLRVLRGHFGPVSDASFSPDGRWVVTAGPVSAALWEVASGELVFYLRGHEGRVVSASFTSDGRRIVTASEDGTVRTYRCAVCGPLDELVVLAERRLRATGRALTPSEQTRYLDEDA
jgi:WD40 repeat protein